MKWNRRSPKSIWSNLRIPLRVTEVGGGMDDCAQSGNSNGLPRNHKLFEMVRGDSIL
jgi:hypothetical protein